MSGVISGYEIYAPSFSVTLVKSGKNIPRDSITSIEIDESIDSPSRFSISLNEMLDIKTQKFRWLDDSRIKPGTEIAIIFGYAMPPEKKSMMMGRIKGINPGFLSSSTPSLTIDGYDLSHDMQKMDGKMSYKDVTVYLVMLDVASNNHLKPAGIEPTFVKHDIIDRKKNEKDYAFARRLADDIGFEFFIRGDTMYFRKPRDKEQGSMTFELGKNIISFNPRLTSAKAVNKVVVTGWTAKDKEPINESATINDIISSVGIPSFESIVEESQEKSTTVKLEGRVVKSKKEAKDIATNELKKRNKCFIEGSLECAGDPELRPGMTINIIKVGDKFSGVYYIRNAKHTIGDSGYRTVLSVCRCL